MTLARPFAVTLVPALLLLLALPGGARRTQAAPGLAKVVIAQGFVGAAAVALATARHLGLFEKYGIAAEVETMNSTQAIQSLIAGKVQVMFGAPAQGLSANAAGELVRDVATLAPNMPYLVLARKPTAAGAPAESPCGRRRGPGLTPPAACPATGGRG